MLEETVSTSYRLYIIRKIAPLELKFIIVRSKRCIFIFTRVVFADGRSKGSEIALSVSNMTSVAFSLLRRVPLGCPVDQRLISGGLRASYRANLRVPGQSAAWRVVVVWLTSPPIASPGLPSFLPCRRIVLPQLSYDTCRAIAKLGFAPPAPIVCMSHPVLHG